MPIFVVFVLQTSCVIKLIEVNTKFVVIITLYIQFWINRKLKNCAWKQGGSSCHLETFYSRGWFFIVFRHCEIEVNPNRQSSNVTKQTAVFKNWFLAESIYISWSQFVLRFYETKSIMECCMNTEKLEILQEIMKSAFAWSYQTTIFAFRIIYFQVFFWSNYFAYCNESIFACWVLRKKSFYVIKVLKLPVWPYNNHDTFSQPTVF